MLNGNSGYVHAHYYGLRFYNRFLTADERYANAAVDGLRFFSYTYTGTGAAERPMPYKARLRGTSRCRSL